jgi:peptidoglycan/xylan/chitin deacetylase (PgdA/CDA1 family)
MDEGGTAGPTKFQVLATKGVPTFLLLEGAANSKVRIARRDAEGERLGALAMGIEGRLPPPEDRPWPGGFAVTLGELAVGDFFPRGAGLASPAVQDHALYRTLASGRYVRAVNFHATPERLAEQLEEQLSRLAASFAPVSYGDLERFVETGEWTHKRPGVILNFFDGFRDNFEVVAPILDRLGMIGWFFIISGWVTTSPEDQRSFATRHSIDLPYHEEDLPYDGRLALSPEELRDLAGRGHVVASHTRRHVSASPKSVLNLSPLDLEREAVASKRDLEKITGQSVGALAWLEGAALGTNGEADEALARAGYKFLFANHAVQRVP